MWATPLPANVISHCMYRSSVCSIMSASSLSQSHPAAAPAACPSPPPSLSCALDVPEWENNPEKYKYMTENTEKMYCLLKKYRLSDRVKVLVHRNHHGLYIAFEYYDSSNWMPDFWSYNIFQDRRETWRCNGVSIYTAEKQYYNKQFINMIATREHFRELERAKKQGT